MAKPPKENSLVTQLRHHASEITQRQMKILGINRKDYLRLLDEGSSVARQLSKDYLHCKEQDGSRIAAHQQRRLAALRATPRRARWEAASFPRDPSGFPGDPGDPIGPDLPIGPDDFPPEGFPPEGRPFDDKPVFPEIKCFYKPLTTLDTVARHVHQNVVDGVVTDATFTDDLAAGVNLCHPVAEIVSLLEEGEKEVGFLSSFRFNFTPAGFGTFRFKPAAFVNGFAFTYEQSGISGGIYVGPQWSISVNLTLRVSQFLSGTFQRITRPVFSATQGVSPSADVFYDSTSDTEADLAVDLESNQRAHVVVTLSATLRSLNSFPSLRFDGTEQYFKVPEIYVDHLECVRQGTLLIRT